MARKKITIAGAGNVGATAAFIAAQRQLADIVLVDIVEGLAEGKALDISQAAGLCGYDVKICGTIDWTKTAASDIVIITSGMPRKAGMSRDDLLAKNTGIVKNVTEQIVKYSPNAFIIVVCNPLDAMVSAAAEVSGFDKSKVMGMAGALDSARFCHFLSQKLSVSVKDIDCILMGGHGDDMVPLPRFTTINGIAIDQLCEQADVAGLVERTRKGGIEIVNLMGTSAYYAPAAGAVQMAEAIIRDCKSIIPCCAYCDSQYDVGGYFVGVPAVLGAGGVEKVIELDLNASEKAELEKSVEHVRNLSQKVKKLL